MLELSNTHVELGEVGRDSVNVSVKETEDASDPIATLDALRVINGLSRGSTVSTTGFFSPDTSGDGLMLPIDALLIINALSRQSAEGEQTSHLFDQALSDWAEDDDQSEQVWTESLLF